MSINGLVVLGAITVTSMGIIARACKHPRAQKTSSTPNNSVPNNAVRVNSSKSQVEASRDLGTALCAA
jgi:hypothetical protein